MKIKSKLLILFLVLTICLFPVKSVFAGVSPGNAAITLPETDHNFTGLSSLFYIFDLRERETFIQLTFPDTLGFAGAGADGAIAHVQIFDVSNNCNENNFTDAYTINDTHVYNMRDIQTNDGNSSGVVLPDGAYGIVVVTMVSTVGGIPAGIATPIGNLRMIDNNGYEYRTNAQALGDIQGFDPSNNPELFYSFNFNQKGGVSLSDVFGITLFFVGSSIVDSEWIAQPVQGIFSPFDIDIVDNNETIFSCRDIIFSCVDEDNPLLEELLSIAETANVASFEYGINNAIPHSKGGELLCPGNVISEGATILRPEAYPTSQAFLDIINQINGSGPFFFGYIGLNNGNGRGSIDSFWVFNFEIPLP